MSISKKSGVEMGIDFIDFKGIILMKITEKREIAVLGLKGQVRTKSLTILSSKTMLYKFYLIIE